MKISLITPLMLASILVLGSCASDELVSLEVIISEEEDTNEVDDTNDDSDDSTDDSTNDDDTATDDNSTDTTSLAERYIFGDHLVIENSWNTGGCDSPPCDTVSESLVGVFESTVPDDDYFYLSQDESELFLECQLDKGRRIEFKQDTEGSLTSLAKIEMEGVFYDIPDNGVTIAQVHNRGGSGNKPFFRVVLHNDGLETVVRKDPEVSSSETTFSKEEFSFANDMDYDGSSLAMVLEKSGGMVHISVEHNGGIVLDASYEADATTRWVTDTGIANGFYLKAGLYNDDGPHTENLIVGYSTVKFETDDND